MGTSMRAFFPLAGSIGLLLILGIGTSAWAAVELDGDVSVVEPDTGEAALIFQINRSGSVDKDILVTLETRDHPTNSATGGVDYSPVAAGTTLVIPQGMPYASIPITVYGDLDAEPDESFFLHLTRAIELAGPSFPSAIFGTGGSVAVGDLDGDGKPDLVVAGGGSGISVLRNASTTGTINASSFEKSVDIDTGGTTYNTSVVIGDLDGDGKLDLALPNIDSNTVSVLRNVSNPGVIDASSFRPRIEFPVGTKPNSVAVGDLDADGKPDLVVTNSTSRSISVLRNASVAGVINASSFQSRVDFATGSYPRSIAISDLDGDGKSDIAVANGSSNSISVLRNTSVPGVIDGSSFADGRGFSTGSAPQSVAAADIDGDGKPDLVVGANGAAAASVLRNASAPGAINAGSFEARDDLAVGQFLSLALISDLDGDAKPDLVLAANNGSDGISMLRNVSAPGATSTDSFELRNDFTNGAASRLFAIEDMDGDGKSDLIVAGISVLRNTSAAGHVADGSFAARDDFQVGSFPSAVAVGDLDGDGKLDLAVASQNPNVISILRNTNSAAGITPASFQSRTDIAMEAPASIAIGDLDRDGKPDLAVANGTNVSVLRNVSTPGTITAASFEARRDFTTESSSFVAIGDLDGDDKPDLVTANPASQNISVLRNVSTPGSIDADSFQGRVDFETGICPESVAIGDLDGDGKPDIAVANRGTFCFGSEQSSAAGPDDSISVLRNSGAQGVIDSSSFEAHVDYATGESSRAVAIGDISGDGRPDLVVASEGIGVSVFRNVGTPGSIDAGSFETRFDFVPGFEASSVAINDLDGDGRLDLAVTDYGANALSVFRNLNVTGEIDASSFRAVRSTALDGPASVVVGDLSGDGKPDIAVANAAGNGVSIFEAASDTPVSITTSDATGTILTNESPPPGGDSNGGAISLAMLIGLAVPWTLRRRRVSSPHVAFGCDA